MTDLETLLRALIEGDVRIEVTFKVIIEQRVEQPFIARCMVCGWSNRYRHKSSRARAERNHANECPGRRVSNAPSLNGAKH